MTLCVHHFWNGEDSASICGSKCCPFQGKALAILQGNHVYGYWASCYAKAYEEAHVKQKSDDEWESLEDIVVMAASLKNIKVP